MLTDTQTEDIDRSLPGQDMQLDTIPLHDRYRSVAIVDGMAELQGFDTQLWIQTCKKLTCRYDEAEASLRL